ncbi:MAG: NACHT domain-containing protein [Rhizonema sp. PD38]|nr:NACHT domain-containing protein [Rhizonema sp. PD38]
MEVSPQERTVSNSPNSEVQHGKYITNIGHVENLHHIGDKIDHKHANPVPLSSEEQKEAVLQFLQAMEENFKYIKLFHTPQQIVLKKQYIPIQVTLERRYKHEVETTWSYAESEAEIKRIYALKGFQEESKETIVTWEDAKKEVKKEAKQENYKIMILADPGMGKSTLLKMEAGAISQSEKQKLLENQINVEGLILPIFLRLSDLVKDSAEVIDIIPQIVQREYPRITEKFQQLLQEKLKTGKCLLLLDALDEVPKEHRLDLKDKLNRFTRNYPCSIISTSRIVGYGGNFIEDAKEVEIVPFSQKQTKEYIETWFVNAAGYINDDLVSAKGLIEELHHKPQISGLAQNPLLLSLLCSLYQEKGLKLPARRVQVYEKTVNYMLSQWSQHRKSLSEGEIEAKRHLLEELTYHFSSSDKEIFSGSELFEQIKKYKEEEGKSSNTLMTELTEEYGILQKLNRESNEYLFLHRTFQEYLTACYLNRAIKKNQKDGIALAKKLFWQYDWHETLTLLAGLMEDAQPLLTAPNFYLQNFGKQSRRKIPLLWHC